MKIKEGYNSKELEIRINGNSNGSIELWIIQNGLPAEILEKYKETLSYITLTELHDLKKEIDRAVIDVFNI